MVQINARASWDTLPAFLHLILPFIKIRKKKKSVLISSTLTLLVGVFESFRGRLRGSVFTIKFVAHFPPGGDRMWLLKTTQHLAALQITFDLDMKSAYKMIKTIPT